MNLIFENVEDRLNFTNCDDINSSGIRRLTASPMVASMMSWKDLKFPRSRLGKLSLTVDSWSNRKTYDSYIISTGVTHSPNDWCGYTDLGKQYDPYMLERKSVFAYLSEKQLSAMRKKKCFLLLDQSHEGYHTNWLFDWFSDCCTQYNVSPTQIIYVTGNLGVIEEYANWCNEHPDKEHMCVIPNIQFEEFIYDTAEKQVEIIPTSDKQIEYKIQNINNIKIYNAFQKRSRPHRIWLFSKLYENNLIDHGINSMNAFSYRNSYYEGKMLDVELYNSVIKLLPMYPRTDLDDNFKDGFQGPLGGLFERDLNHQATLDSWVSVISEASFAENTCFISEKTFKPIATRHPFIMYGNKHSLQYLRTLGYKTFDGFIDESYDDLESWERLDAIIKILKDIRDMPDEKKIQWFSSMKDILDHNFKVLKDNSTVNMPNAIDTLRDYVSGVNHA
jgi:hypothetical protein